MGQEDLLIKIDSDISGVQEKFDDIQSKTENLQGSLNDIAKVAAVGFAALTAQVGLSVAAFVEASNISKELSNSLQNQGIFTQALKTNYVDYAEEISNVTGLNALQIQQAEGVAQTYLHQLPVTKELTQAIADLAVKQGVSLPEAATELGKAIGNGTGMLLRQGLQFASTDTEADRYTKTLQFMQTYAGGAAAAQDPLTIATGRMKNAFEESSVALGAEFAPAVTLAVNAITSFITPSKDASGVMTDLKAGFIAAGLVITGLGVTLPLAANGFLAVRAAALAMNLTLNATKIALAGIGIGLVIAALVLLVTNWTTVSAQVVAIVKGLVTVVSGAFTGLSTILQGAFTLDVGKIKEGLAQVHAAFSAGTNQYKATLKDREGALVKHEEVQDTTRKAAADKEASVRTAAESAKKQLATAQAQLIQLETEQASDALIALKKQEVQELTELEKAKDANLKALLTQQVAATRALEAQQQATDIQQEEAYGQADLAAMKSLADRKIASYNTLSQKENQAIQKTVETQSQAQNKVYSDERKVQVAAHNTFIEEQIKYGTAYAAINESIHSEEVQGAQKGFSDLSQMTQSSNATLKSIGKAASIADITIKTAQAAMNIYSGFSAIPFVGQALGIAGAAAAIAFGAEQIGNVTAAQAGGIVPGIGSGDIMPAMLEPGELIAPKQNFDEVVNSVAASRSGASQGQSGYATVELSLKGNVMDFIEAKLVQRKALNISITGRS